MRCPGQPAVLRCRAAVTNRPSPPCRRRVLLPRDRCRTRRFQSARVSRSGIPPARDARIPARHRWQCSASTPCRGVDIGIPRRPASCLTHDSRATRPIQPGREPLAGVVGSFVLADSGVGSRTENEKGNRRPRGGTVWCGRGFPGVVSGCCTGVGRPTKRAVPPPPSLPLRTMSTAALHRTERPARSAARCGSSTMGPLQRPRACQ